MTIDIDLTTHALIEASAGTGKTYTIENLVVRLLVEKVIPISKILLVTFTEKATSEMKARIRKKLEEVIQTDTTHHTVLESLTYFDQAAVMTIHSFCKQVLQQYSFENGILFDLDLCDTTELYRTALRDIQRGWTHVDREYLDSSVYHDQERIADWEDLVIRTARDYNPSLNDRLSTADDIPEKIKWNEISADIIRKVHNRVRASSREKGSISYDDLLRLVDEALQQDTPAADRLRQSLRNQYRYAFVDEFQDTDPTQWRIFRKLFIEHKQENRLFLVGDPKQSIYRFRGADIYTYLAAKQTMQQIGRMYNLDKNRRSTPNLITFQNWLFSKAWFPEAGGIDYNPVLSPDGKQGKRPFIHDRSNRKSALFLSLPKLNAQPLRQCYAKWIALEISHLLRRDILGHPMLTIADSGGNPQAIQPGDICILVNTRSEGETFTRYLDGKVPYTFYKQTGVYASEEALHLFYLLDALANPRNDYKRKQALLTHFFQIDIEEFLKNELSTRSQESFNLLDAWARYATRRQWTHLFDSILNDSLIHFQYGKTVCARDERSIATYRHLIEDLMEIVGESMMDIGMLAQHFDRKRRQRILLEREEDLHRIDTESSKVQVMTIHASKGLEFPVVFLAGISLRRSPEVSDFYHDNDTKVYRVGKSDTEKEDAQRELENEQRRLYYVAITRAMNRVYLPLIGGTELRGNQGAIFKFTGIPSEIADFCEKVQLDQDEIESAYQKIVPIENEKSPPSHFDYKAPDLKRINTRGIQIESFSSLHHHHIETQPRTSIGIEAEEGVSLPLIDDVNDEVANDEPTQPDVLPPGARSGDLLHAIFQWIPFEEVAVAATPDHLLDKGSRSHSIITKAYARSEISRSITHDNHAHCLLRIAHIIWHSLKVPPGGAIRYPPLAGIPSSDRRHEIEFHLSDAIIEKYLSRDIRRPHSLLRRYLKGYIDLVFRYEERYYVVDWKSNTLPHYNESSVSHCIQQNQYDLQYTIYWVALTEWLKKTVHNFDPAIHLGGVAYYFIRGIDQSSPGTGIYHRNASDLAHRSQNTPTIISELPR